MAWEIPRVGTEVMLAKDWTFMLHDERRNDSLMKHLSIPKGTRKLIRVADDSKYGWRWGYEHNDPSKCRLPAGTVLTVDRVYVRQDAGWGSDAFNSLTFKMKFPGAKKITRFWATLEDVRKMCVKELKF